MQIACRNKDRESVEILLKYLIPKHKQQLAKEETFLFKYTPTVAAKDMREFQRAISFIKVEGIHTEENENILIRSFQDMCREFEPVCYCVQDPCIPELKRQADSLTKKCFQCIRFCRRRFRDLRDSTCSSDNTFDVLRYLIEKEADISDYVLSRKMHNWCIFAKYPRCSVVLLLRSFGMKSLRYYHFDGLVQTYWRNHEYEMLGILYMCVRIFRDQAITNNLMGQFTKIRPDSLLFLQDCISHTTHIDIDMAGLSTIQYLQYAARQPRTLQNYCIITIRRSISSNVIKKAEHLPLPLSLKNAVTLTNFQTRCSTSGVCHNVIN